MLGNISSLIEWPLYGTVWTNRQLTQLPCTLSKRNYLSITSRATARALCFMALNEPLTHLYLIILFCSLNNIVATFRMLPMFQSLSSSGKKRQQCSKLGVNSFHQFIPNALIALSKKVLCMP